MVQAILLGFYQERDPKRFFAGAFSDGVEFQPDGRHADGLEVIQEIPGTVAYGKLRRSNSQTYTPIASQKAASLCSLAATLSGPHTLSRQLASLSSFRRLSPPKDRRSSRSRIGGRTEDRRDVPISPDTLLRYASSYARVKMIRRVLSTERS
jgi:hypothetical protein